jgi:TldD protein
LRSRGRRRCCLAEAHRLGASYADVRVSRYRFESIATREHQVRNISRTQNAGFGVRVLVNGTWGFAASPNLTADEAQRVTAAAVDIARANARLQRKRIELAPAGKVETSWKSVFQRDPFDVPLDEKVQFLALSMPRPPRSKA